MRGLKDAKKKSNDGITLIALMVTVIVIIILATITIETLSGKNNIIINAGRAKQQAEIESEMKEVGLAANQAKTKNRYGDVEQTQLENALDYNLGKGKTTVTYNKQNSIFFVKYKDSGRVYVVNTIGDVEYIKPKSGYSIAVIANPSVGIVPKPVYEVNITLKNSDDTGTIPTNEIKYGWNTSNSEEPSTFLKENLVTAKDSDGNDDTSGKTTENPISSNSLEEGSHYLWIKIDLDSDGKDDITKVFGPYNIITSGTILEIDPNGGTYEGSKDITRVSKDASGEPYKYGDNYKLSNVLVPPSRATVYFDTNEGKSIDPIEVRKVFTRWTLSGRGTLFGNVNTGYTYKFGNGIGNLKANYKLSNNTITLPKTTRIGYTFTGWYFDKACTSKVGDAGDEYLIKSSDSSITLYAGWKANEVEIAINKNGSAWSNSGMNVALYSGTTLKYEYSKGETSGSTVKWIAVADGTYNIYAGNNDGAKTDLVDTGVDVTISGTGAATINYYTLTLNIGAGISNVTGGATYLSNQKAKIEATASTGYTFTNWTVNDGNTPASTTLASTTVSTSKKTILTANAQDKTAPTRPQITAKMNNASGTAYTSGTWTNNNVYIELTSKDEGSGIKEYQWYENGAWTTRALTTSDNKGTITYIAERDTTIRFRAVDKAGNISEENTIAVKIDKTAPTRPQITAKMNNASGTAYTSGTWTNNNVYIELTSKEEGAGIKEYQWYENGAWTTRALTTSGNNGTITYTAERDTTIRFRAVDKAGNTSEENTIAVKIDKTAPTFNATISNVSSTGYDVIITGVSDKQSGVNRIQCPTWTEANGQDDIDGSWQTSAKSKATKQSDGSYKFRVNITDHKNENGKYITHVYGYDNVGNNKAIALSTTVPAVKITWNSNGGTAVNATSGKAGNAIGTLPTTTRTGYTFAGWFTAASGGTQITTSSTYPTNGDVTYYAHWNVNQYTLTYNGNGGTPSKTSQTTKYDTAWGALATATRTGYSFEGWYTAASGGTQVTDTTVCKGNTTVYAKWKLITLKSCSGEWTSTSPFLGNSTIKRNMIERVNLVTSISGHSTSDTNCWDVSDSQNGKILAWYEDADSDGYYEVTIGQDGGINANAKSSYLFSYIGYNGDDTTVINGIENLNTSNVTNMGAMFFDCKNLTSLDVSNFDTSNVTGMVSMFINCHNLTSLDVSNFDTSKVTDMEDMFYDCSNLTSLNVSKFDTRNVTNMRGMFFGCNNLTSLDVSKFDTSKVTDMYWMFAGCSNLTSLDVSKFDTRNVTDMGKMFLECNNLTSLDVSKFDTSKVTDMKYMFDGCKNLTSLDVSKFDTSKVTDMSDMFSSCRNLTSLDVSKFDTSKVTDMDSMFYRCENLTSLDVSKFDTSKVTDMGGMFYDCQNLTSLDVSKFDTSNVTDMRGMFLECNNLTSLDVSNFDTSKVTYIGWMFAGCSNLTSLDVSKFDTSKVTDMSQMFYGCSNLTSLDVSNFDTSKVTDMGSMFSGCSNLTSLDVSNFDTSKVTDMYWMFSSCENLTSLDVSKFDTSNVTDMDCMFSRCNKLRTVYAGNKWNTDKVTSSKNMFYEDSSLVGGAGTTYDSSHVDKAYAHIDGGTSNPGYFTSK